MEFRLLGSVSLVTESGDVAPGPVKRATLLAMLLLRPNTAVSVDQLADGLWEDEPPTHFRTVLQGHVSRLRALLAAHGAESYGVELATHGSAYLLRLPESLVDAHRFEEFVGLARSQKQPADTVRMLREALACWQGPALTGTVCSGPLEAAAGGLEDLRLASVEALAEAYGQLGEHGRAAAVLRTEAVAHPLRESLAAALMLALGRAGRQSDAINWFHRTRRLLAEELGVDPGETLSEAYTTLLRATEPPRAPAGRAGAPTGPAGAAGAPGGAGGHGTPGGNGGHAGTGGPGASAGWGAQGGPAAPGGAGMPAGSAGPGTPTGWDAQGVPGVPAGTAGSGDPAGWAASAGATAPGAPGGPAGPAVPGVSAGWGGVPGGPGTSSGTAEAGTRGAPAGPTAPGAPGGTAGPGALPGWAVTTVPGAPGGPGVPGALAGWVVPGVPLGAGGPVVPEMLPRPPRGFTGRSGELDALGGAAGGGHAPVCLVTGPAGVGKTAFALHWAYERRPDFPDGRLFADLRGFSDTPAPDAASVLRDFLLALGVPADRVPETADARGALFRSLVSGRRLLVVLDNARSSEQVRPLLPGGDRCVTLVTSRDRLGGLVASDAARPVPLGHLPRDGAAALLASVLGAERVAAEPAAAAQLARLCDGLPLALRVTAARLAERPQWTLDAMAGRLADEQSRLAQLDVEDTGVSAALRLTVLQLPDSAARMFRSLGLHTGSDLDRFAAAALAGTAPAQAMADLDRLGAAHLLTESVAGRWTPHDLVRLYARELAPQADPEGLPRLLDHYLCTGLVADAAAEPGSQPCYALPAGARRPAAIREFEDREAALAWYAAERTALAGAVAAATGAGLHDRAWRLVLLQWPLILVRITDGWVPLLESGLAASELDGDLDAQSRTRALLGWVLHEEGRDAEALVHLERAPDLAERAGDVISEAIARVNLAVVLDATGDRGRAAPQMARAVELAEESGHPPTQVLTLQHLARYCLDAHAYDEALAHALRAAELISPAARIGRAQLQIVHGEALAGLGRLEEAADQLGRAKAAADAAGFEEVAARAADTLARLPLAR